MASGGIFGGFTALRYGLRGRELIKQVKNDSKTLFYF
jgi:hypothetical protein